MMEIRNPRYTATGRIDCEINHPEFGWLPFTASPEDAEPHGREIFALAEALGPTANVPPSQEELFDQIKMRRDQAIGAGVTVAGIMVHTDETSQTRIMGATVAAMLDPDYSVQWKTADGTFVTLSAAQVIGIASAVRAHVQAAFDREAVLRAAVLANEPYDIEAGWP